MADDRPITPEQALIAVKAAGLDPDKSLTAQLEGDQSGDLERQVAELSEQIKTLTEALDVAGQPTDPQSHERRVAEGYREALNRSLTPWIGEEHDDAP
jgi:hypothetical protein